MTYHVSGSGQRIGYWGDIVIPDVVTYGNEEYKVTGIDDYTFKGNEITSVVIGKNVKLIGQEAFNGCTLVKSVVIPASVDSISNWAFSDTGLKTVTLEDGENPIRLWSWGGYSLFNGSPLETVYLGRNYICERAPFSGFTTLKNATVSDIVTRLQVGEFNGCRGLRNVKLGRNITDIGDNAFYHCDTLTAITLPDAVTRIGGEAFESCDTLSSINIPANVKLIDWEAFQSCHHLQTISIPASVDSISNWAFSDTGLKTVYFEDGEHTVHLWSWGGYSLFNGSPLETVYMGRPWESERAPFSGFTTIKTVHVGPLVTQMSTVEYNGCPNITAVYSHSVVPPFCGSEEVFEQAVYQHAQLSVPEQSIDAYKSATMWRQFFNITSGISETEMAGENGTDNGRWYTIGGLQTATPKRGLFIHNGKKVVVK